MVKIAVSHQGLRLTVDEITAWFRTDGDPEQADRQEGLLMDLLPGLAVVGRTTVPCVTTYTPSGHPVVDDLTPRVSAVIGGNGHVAKCAPALGEIAAGCLLGEPWPTGVDRDLFALPAG